MTMPWCDRASAAFVSVVAAGAFASAGVGVGVGATMKWPPRNCGSIAIDYRPSRAEHNTRMFISAPVAVPCRAARRAMLRYRADGGPCVGAYCARAYRDDWVCDAPIQQEWPVIEECFWQSPDMRVVGRVNPKPGPRALPVRRNVSSRVVRPARPDISHP